MQRAAFLSFIALIAACLRPGALFSNEAAAPTVAAIYPSGATVPANHLKFYIHFTQPMRQGVFLEHCSLLDENGQPVPEPFRETELWSEDRMRLTLWFHPGRQKTGVNLNEEFGPVLELHRKYTLILSAKWPSEGGVPLGKDVRKRFETVERATAQLDISNWRITAPPAGTGEPLRVRFPAPLDHALLQRCLRIVDENDAPVAGTSETTDHECGWRFTPERPWSSGSHRLRVETVLEDLAGNSLARPFEVDLHGPAPRIVPPVVQVPFRPRPPGSSEPAAQ
jgi:hypothetical protein